MIRYGPWLLIRYMSANKRVIKGNFEYKNIMQLHHPCEKTGHYCIDIDISFCSVTQNITGTGQKTC